MLANDYLYPLQSNLMFHYIWKNFSIQLPFHIVVHQIFTLSKDISPYSLQKTISLNFGIKIFISKDFVNHFVGFNLVDNFYI